MLRRGKDMVTVILRENRVGPRGVKDTVPIGEVDVLGRMQQVSSSDVQAFAAAGESQVLQLKRFYCRSFPGDDLSQVVDGDNIIYNVVGQPQRHIGSRRTARDVVTLRQAGVKRTGVDGTGL